MIDIMPPDPQDLLPLPTASFHILLALSEQDLHGYSIMREVGQRSGGTVRMGPATLYTTIKRLLSEGLIEELDERPEPGADDQRRRYYRLSPFGRQVARAELNRLQALVRQAKTSLARG